MSKTNYTRRGFLKTASLSGAGLLIASNLFARNCVSPNGRINLGVIGCGKMADGHIGGMIHNDKCRLVALCDVDSARMEYQKQRIENGYKSRNAAAEPLKMYKDFRELLADPSIDAVLIATPDHWHAIPAICAAEAGKAVYCEKPLTFTIEEGRKVVDAVHRTGAVFQVGSQQRSSPEFRRAVELVRNGYAGEIKEVWVGVGVGGPEPMNWKPEECPETIDWEMWCGPAPYNPYFSNLLPKFDPAHPYDHGWNAWRSHIDYGNGGQADWGAHQFDIAMWGLGLDGQGIKYVNVSDKGDMPGGKGWRQYKYVTESGIPLYKGLYPKCPKKIDGGLTFVGTEGVIAAARGHFYSSDPALATARLTDKDEFVLNSENHRDNFFDAVLKGTPLAAPVEVGHSTCALCILGNIANNLGRDLEWDWRAEKFVNDPEADRFLRRANRGQWAMY